jgi:hypothetical protein
MPPFHASTGLLRFEKPLARRCVAQPLVSADEVVSTRPIRNGDECGGELHRIGGAPLVRREQSHGSLINWLDRLDLGPCGRQFPELPSHRDELRGS